MGNSATSKYSASEIEEFFDDPAVKVKFNLAVDEKAGEMFDDEISSSRRSSSTYKPLTLVNKTTATANLLRDLQSLIDEVVEARDFIPEYSSLVFSKTDPSTAKFQRVAVSALKRGYIIPLFSTLKSSIQDDPEETVCGFHAFYTVVSMSNGTVELLLVADYQKSVSGKACVNRATFNRIDDDRTVLVLSTCSIESQFLPISVITSMADFSITPSSPPDGCDRLGAISSSTSGAQNSSTIKALVREAALAPLRRALHNDQSLLSHVVGPLCDLSSKVTLNNLRNLQSSTRLRDLPFWSKTEHLEAFLGFRWSDQPYINGSKKTYDGMHLSLFLPLDAYDNYSKFHTCADITTALDNLEFACVELFQEKPDRPFFSAIFRPLLRLLSCSGVMNSIQSMDIDFLVWKFSRILVQWALLYTDESRTLANATFAAFLENNEQVLNFRASDFKDEFARVDLKYLPRQGNNIINGGFGNLTTSSPPQQASKAVARKRKAKSITVPAPPAVNKSLKTSTASPKASSPVPVKGKYICAGDLLHKVDPTEYPACKKSTEDCNQRHVAKPAVLLPKDREELLTSISRMQGIVNLRKAQMCASINAMP